MQEENYMNFLKNIYFYEKVEKLKKLKEYKAIPESTKRYLEEQIHSYQKGLNTQETLEQWKTAKEYLKNRENIDKRLGNFSESNPIYISMLYLIKSNVFELLPIYEEIINKNWYRPNNHYYINGHYLFWSSLPNPFLLQEQKLIDLNMKVMENNEIDFHILNSGVDPMRLYLEYILDTNHLTKVSLEEKKYYMKLLQTATKNNLSLLDTNRNILGLEESKKPLIKDILSATSNLSEFESYKKYILSENGVKHQVQISMPQKDGEAIETYINYLPKDQEYDKKKELLLSLKK